MNNNFGSLVLRSCLFASSFKSFGVELHMRLLNVLAKDFDTCLKLRIDHFRVSIILVVSQILGIWSSEIIFNIPPLPVNV